jgi:hypothetical protein
MYVHGQISIPFDIRMSSLSDAAMDTAGVLLGYRSLGIEKMMEGKEEKWVGISGWWFGTCFIFPYIGNFIIPTDEFTFFRGVGIPPTRY